MTKVTKVVKVPVRIAEEDETLKKIKYRALDRLMNEARYLGNVALRYYVAYNLKEIPSVTDEKTEKAVPLDTVIYRILANERQHMNSGNMATLARNFAGKLFRASNRDAWAGRKSLPTYRAKFMPFRSNGTRIDNIQQEGETEQFVIEPQGFGPKWLSRELIEEASDNGIPDHFTPSKLRLISTFSWKDKGAADVVSRIMSGEYKLSDSQIRRGRKGLMCFLTYTFESKPTELDPDRVCGVDLGVVIPAVCAVNFGPQRAFLGDRDDVWAARSKFRSQRRREQRRKGLYSKSRKWTRSENEDRWIHTYYHALTRNVIKFCLQHRCGKIQVENLSALRQKDAESEYRRLMWVPQKFQQLLAYKAEEAGIEMVRINPRNTSKRCSECGHISKTNRKSQSEFICEKCGVGKKPVNADYNAARNLALATGDVVTEGYRDEVLDRLDPLWEESQEINNR